MKKFVITSEQLRKIEMGKQRKNAQEQGFYDGRFAPKVFKDKKKEENRYKCRKNKYCE